MDHGRMKLLICPILVALLLVGCSQPSVPPAPPSKPVTQPSLPPTETNSQPPEKDPKRLLSRADDLLLKGDAPGAADLLIRFVGRFPEEAPGWDLLGLAYSRMGKFKVAQLVSERAAALAPANAAARFNAGIANANAADLQRAVVHLEEAARLNQTQADPIYMLAKVYEASPRQKDKARSTYEEAVKRFPADKDVLRARAAFEADLTMDGKPERITINLKTATVIDGASGAVLGTAPDSQFAPAADIGGEAPVLVTVSPSYLTVYTSQGRLSEVGRFSSASASYSQVNRAIVVQTVTDQEKQVAFYRLQDGKLAAAKTFSYPANPFAPPTSLVDLFAKVATMNPAAFADDHVTLGLLNRLAPDVPGRIQAPFLLVHADGTYEVTIFQEGKITATVEAEVKEYKIAALRWGK